MHSLHFGLPVQPLLPCSVNWSSSVSVVLSSLLCVTWSSLLCVTWSSLLCDLVFTVVCDLVFPVVCDLVFPVVCDLVFPSHCRQLFPSLVSRGLFQSMGLGHSSSHSHWLPCPKTEPVYRLWLSWLLSTSCPPIYCSVYVI